MGAKKAACFSEHGEEDWGGHKNEKKHHSFECNFHIAILIDVACGSLQV